jgi:hypothetical protein
MRLLVKDNGVRLSPATVFRNPAGLGPQERAYRITPKSRGMTAYFGNGSVAGRTLLGLGTLIAGIIGMIFLFGKIRALTKKNLMTSPPEQSDSPADKATISTAEPSKKPLTFRPTTAKNQQKKASTPVRVIKKPSITPDKARWHHR